MPGHTLPNLAQPSQALPRRVRPRLGAYAASYRERRGPADESPTGAVPCHASPSHATPSPAEPCQATPRQAAPRAPLDWGALRRRPIARAAPGGYARVLPRGAIRAPCYGAVDIGGGGAVGPQGPQDARQRPPRADLRDSPALTPSRPPRAAHERLSAILALTPIAAIARGARRRRVSAERAPAHPRLAVPRLAPPCLPDPAAPCPALPRTPPGGGVRRILS